MIDRTAWDEMFADVIKPKKNSNRLCEYPGCNRKKASRKNPTGVSYLKYCPSHMRRMYAGNLHRPIKNYRSNEK